ncbi:hypothetical protein THS27_07135 [Thalassospira sp. MCCC 1A01428]|nr:hypothetical protein THS27_07135 [Thalassospira sp. MCCC 1A01428]
MPTYNVAGYTRIGAGNFEKTWFSLPARFSQFLLRYLRHSLVRSSHLHGKINQVPMRSAVSHRLFHPFYSGACRGHIAGRVTAVCRGGLPCGMSLPE